MRNETSYSGLRLPADRIRDERLKIAQDMLALSLRDTAAVLPVRVQQLMRRAVLALREVEAWCQRHR